jgi:hypothetical protein
MLASVSARFVMGSGSVAAVPDVVIGGTIRVEPRWVK